MEGSVLLEIGDVDQSQPPAGIIKQRLCIHAFGGEGVNQEVTVKGECVEEELGSIRIIKSSGCVFIEIPDLIERCCKSHL